MTMSSSLTATRPRRGMFSRNIPIAVTAVSSVPAEQQGVDVGERAAYRPAYRQASLPPTRRRLPERLFSYPRRRCTTSNNIGFESGVGIFVRIGAYQSRPGVRLALNLLGRGGTRSKFSWAPRVRCSDATLRLVRLNITNSVLISTICGGLRKTQHHMGNVDSYERLPGIAHQRLRSIERHIGASRYRRLFATRWLCPPRFDATGNGLTVNPKQHRINIWSAASSGFRNRRRHQRTS